MKWVAIAILIAGTVAAVNAQACDVKEDCEESECCLATSTAALMFGGVCRPKTRLNQPCMEDSDIIANFGNKFLNSCPCRSNFECKSTNNQADKETNPRLYYSSLRCQRKKKPEVTTTKPTTQPGFFGDEATEPATDLPAEEGFLGEETGEDEKDEQPAGGPGGEPPRDDDCEDWELPC